MAQPPPPYDPNAQHGPQGQYDQHGQQGQYGQHGHAAPATNLPGEPVGMQPMGQTNMNVGQKVTPLHLLSDRPEFVDCQMCEQRARTRVEKKGEGMQFLTGALLCLVCICLAPLPCCLHWFEQTNWYCDKCGKQIATRTPESPVHVLPPPHALSVPSQYGPGPQGPPHGHPPPHMNAPQSPPVGPPMSPPSNAATAPNSYGTPPPVIQTPPGNENAPPPVIQHPEIVTAPTPGQAPGGPESLPMKN